MNSRGAAESIENKPPMMRLEVAARVAKTTIANQATMADCPGDGDRVERGVRIELSEFAEGNAVGDGTNCGKGPDEGEFGAPAKAVIECAAEQQQGSGGCGHYHSD